MFSFIKERMKISKVSHPWNHINQDFSKHLHAALSFRTFSTKQFLRRATLQSVTYLNLNAKFSFIIPPLSAAVALLVLCLCGLAVREFSLALRAPSAPATSARLFFGFAFFFLHERRKTSYHSWPVALERKGHPH